MRDLGEEFRKEFPHLAIELNSERIPRCLRRG